ncbi:MAG: hypothetical protein RI911_807 [Candidatus Parcubacteria bacterium]|jgi:hypothetical protein
MKRSSETIRRVLTAARNAGFSPEERSSIVDGNFFRDKEESLLGLLRTTLKESKRRQRIMQILELHDRRALSPGRIFKLTQRFEDIVKNTNETLTHDDIRFINFALHYMEDWFYNGAWASPSPEFRNSERAFEQFALPAAITNLLAKYKEDGGVNLKLYDLNGQRLRKFIAAVEAYIASYPGTLLGYSKEVMRDSCRAAKDELFEGANSGSILYFFKTCMIAGEMVRRTHIGEKYTLPAAEKTARAQYRLFNFGNRASEGLSTHYPNTRILFAIAVVTYLQSKAQSTSAQSS